MKASRHAGIRAQQRGIPHDCIDLIMQFGSPEKRPGNALEYRLTKRGVREAVNHLKHLIQQIDKAARKAVLVSEDADYIVTVYNQTR